MSLATPREGGRRGIPPRHGRFEPRDDLLCGLGVLPGQCAGHNNPLQGLGHVQPGAAQARIERHDALLEQPAHDRPALMTCQVIPDQNHPQRRQGRLGWMAEPGRPLRRHGALRLRNRYHGEAVQDGGDVRLEPGMEHGIRAARHPRGAHDPAGRMEQGQQLRGTTPHIFVGLPRWVADGLPGCARVRDCLIRSGFILTPDRNAGGLGRVVRLVDQPLV